MDRPVKMRLVGQSDGKGSEFSDQPHDSGDKPGLSCNEQGDNQKAPSQGRALGEGKLTSSRDSETKLPNTLHKLHSLGIHTHFFK